MLLFLFPFVACNSDKRLNMYIDQNDDIIGRKLVFDNAAQEINYRKLQVESDFTILCTNYTDCSTCAITLFDCDSYLKRNKKLNNIKVKFVVSGLETEYYFHQVNDNDFTFSVVYDNDFVSRNRLESYSNEVFLLDKDNRIILIGSPFDNPVLDRFYKVKIFERI